MLPRAPDQIPSDYLPTTYICCWTLSSMLLVPHHPVYLIVPCIFKLLRYMFPFLALLSGLFRLLSDSPSDTIAIHQTAGLGPVHNIRHLLTSSHPNEQYLFLSCLQCLEPDLWAGTYPDRPAVLEGWEVERVMKLLDSADNLIRKKVCLELSSEISDQLFWPHRH